MSKFVKILVLCAWVTVAAAAEPLDIQSYRDAHARYSQLLVAADSGSAIDLRTPEFNRLVKVLSDEKRFLYARRLATEDIPSMMDMCELADRATDELVSFGAKSRKLSPEDKARIRTLQEQNILVFQPELTLMQPFHIRCLGLTVPLLEEFVRTLPPAQVNQARRDGLKSMSEGYSNMMRGTFMMADDARYGLKYRLELIKAMADATPAFASMLSVEQRSRVLSVVDGAASRAPPEGAADLARIRRALNSTTCARLCALQ